MSARSAAFARLVLGVFLCLIVPFAAHAQTCTPPSIQQIVTSPGNCAGEPVTLDAGEGWVTYVWSNEATGRYMTDAPLVNTAYTVTVTDANGCTVTSQPFEVWVEGTNVAPVIDVQDPMCDWTAVQDASVQPPSNGGTWGNVEWTITGGHFYDPIGTNPTTETGLTVRFEADGTGPVTLTARGQKQSEFYCWSPVATKEIELSSTTVTIEAPDEVCPMAPAYASAAPPPQGGWMAYHWTITGGTFASMYGGSTESYDYNPGFMIDEGATEAVLSLRTRDDQGCWTAVASRTVVARTILAPVIEAPDEVCPMVPASASVAPPPQGGWMAYQWTITGGTFASMYGGSTESYDHNPGFMIDEGATEAVLSLRVRDDQGCWSPIGTRTVQVRTILAPVIEAPDEVCPMVPASASVAPPPQGGWMAYQWTITGGTFASMYGGSTESYDYNPGFMIDEGATEAVLSLRVRDDQGCWSPIGTRTVQVRTILAPVIEAPDEVCPMVPASASVAPPPQGGWMAYQWTITGGTFASMYGGSTESYDYNPGFMIDEGATEAVLSLRVRDDQGCWSPIGTRTVQVRTILAPVIEAPDEVCPMVPASASVAPPPQGGWMAYQWTITGGTFSSMNGASTESYDSNPGFMIDEGATQAILSLRVRDDQGCWSPIGTRTVQARTIPAPVISAPNEACPMMPAPAWVAPPPQGSWFEYEWSITGGTFSGGSFTSNAPSPSFMIEEGASQAVLSLRTRDDQGCWTPIGTRTVQARTIPAPVISAPNEACPMMPAPAWVAPPPQGSWFEYEWSITGGTFSGGSFTSNASSPSFMIEAGASQAVLSLRTRDDLGCWTPVGTRTVLASAVPAAGIRAHNIYGDGDAQVVSNTNGVVEVCGTGMIGLTAEAAYEFNPSYTYLWSTGWDRGSLNVSASGTYSVTVTNPSGCSTTSTVVVNFSNYPAKPSIATPNGTQLCPAGGSVTLTAPAADGWTWSTGATTQSIVVSAAGSYWVRVRSGACESPQSDAVVVSNGQSTITASGSLALCENESVTLTANAGTAWLWSNGATTRAITVSEPGTYSVTTTNGSCVSEESNPVAVTRHEVSIAAGGPTTFCPGSNVTLTAQGDADSYYWSHGPIGPSVVVTEPGTYFVTGHYSGGCSIVSNAIAITVPDTTATIAADRTTVCPGGAIELTSSVSGSTGYTYQWYQGYTYVAIDGATSPSLTINPTTSGFVYLKVTDETGCVTTSNAVLYTVVDPPDATITASGPLTWCGESSVTLTAPDGLSYLWSNGASTQSITVDASGSFSVTVNNGSCSVQSATVVVTEHALPDATVTPSGPLAWCGEGSVTLTAPAGLSYAWSNGATSQSITVDASGSFYVDVNDSNCTVRSATVVVTENALPDATITPSGPLTWCGESSVTLTAPAGLTYAWSNGATSQSITVDASGSFYVDVNNGNCMVRSATVVVTENALPDATVTPSGPLTWCGEGSVTLTAPAGLSYVWSNGATSQSITVDASGSFYVDVNNGNCTVRSATVVVTENALPDATITPSGPLTWCGESSVTLTAPAGLTYLWSNGATSQSITVDASGSFYVDVNNGNCTVRSATVVVTENALPDATITPSGPLTWCGEGSVTLTAPAGLSYVWSNGATSQSITVDASGSFYVDVNNGNCTVRSATVVVTENVLPDATITPSGPLTWCGESSVTLTAPSGLSYVWSNGATSQSITIDASGSFYVDVNNGNCTVRSATVVVTENALPDATVTPSGPLTWCGESSVTLTAPAGLTYLWSNGATSQSITVDASGSFYVDVNNGNCTVRSATVVVTENALPDATITPSGPLTWCGESSVTLTAPAGLSYAWSNGAISQSITVDASGSFYVDVNNGNCTVRSAIVVVTENPLPNATVTVQGSLALCPGSSVTLSAEPGHTYVWSNGSTQQSITVSTPGQYHVTVSNGACTLQSQTYTVTSQPATVITQQPLNTTMPRNQQRTLTVDATAAGGPTYKWYNVSSTGVETLSTNPGNTTSQLTVGPYTKKGTYRFRVYVGSATCTSAPTVPSNIVTVTVN